MADKKLVKSKKLVGRTKSKKARAQAESKTEFDYAVGRARYGNESEITADESIKTVIRPSAPYGKRSKVIEDYYLRRARLMHNCLSGAGQVDFISIRYSRNGAWTDVDIQMRNVKSLDIHKMAKIAAGDRGEDWMRYSNRFLITQYDGNKMQISLQMGPESYQEMYKMVEAEEGR